MIGDTPAGTSLSNPNISLAVPAGTANNFYIKDSASFDINNDGNNDLMIHLTNAIASPFSDIPNILRLKLLNPGIEVCVDNDSRVAQYNVGSLLACNSLNSWGSDFSYIVNCYNSFGCFGAFLITDTYLLYRLNGTTGWIKISYNVSTPNTINNVITEEIN